MIDIHSHILPGIDDGAKDINESIEIARNAVREGIEKMICTPHATGDYDSILEQANESIFILKQKLKDGDISLELDLGFEVLANENFLDYPKPENLAFGKSPHILLEFNFDCFPEKIFDEILYVLKISKIAPILAHPERYEYLYKDTSLIKKIKAQNVKLQINTSSILGAHGFQPKSFAKKLLTKGYADYLASDVHSLGSRGPYIKKAVNLVERWCSPQVANKLTYENQMKIFND